MQRGSVMDMPVYPGDPLTPGVGATKDAKRLALSDAATLTKIPVMPISYGDAQPLLAALQGPVAPAAWRGGLPLTYHIGPGPAKVHLKLAFNWDLKPLYDVIARIPGSRYPDEWIIRGNHHDALGERRGRSGFGNGRGARRGARAGNAAATGLEAERTIIYCIWDGEEPGLLGSTEWAETHADELQQKAAVYINSDSNGRGFLQVEGSHTLEKFLNGVARDIQDPESNVSVWQRLQARRMSPEGGGRGGASAAGPGGSGTAGGLAHRRAGLGLGLYGLSGPLGGSFARSGIRRRGCERHLPFHLRRFLLVHALRRHRFRVRAGAGADGGDGGDAAGRCRVAALTISTISRTPCGATWTKWRSWQQDKREQVIERNRPSTTARSRPSNDPRHKTVTPAKERCRRS